MISVCTYGDGDDQELEPTSISKTIGDHDRLVWVDVSDPTDDELATIEKEFALHPLAMEDVRHRHQRPKLEHYPTHAFVVAYSATLQEVDFFLGPGWLISVRESDEDEQAWSVESARARFARTRPDPPSAGFLLYTLLDELVDGYFDATERSEDKLEVIEDRIFAEELPEEREIQQELFELRRELLLFRRAVVPLREVLAAMLRGEIKWIDDYTTTHLQDVYDHVMKKMTSWGAILLGSTLVAGIYGMNFDHMPELGWEFGYAWALGLMLLVTLAGYRYFRRKDWL